jgi:hypothetical protein
MPTIILRAEQVVQLRKMARQIRPHERRAANRRMNPAEVVVEDVRPT